MVGFAIDEFDEARCSYAIAEWQRGISMIRAVAVL